MDIVCGSCGSENLVRDREVDGSGDIPLVCLDCGWRGRRTPGVSCRRCGSANVDGTPVESWAYADLEEAREDPATAEWGYLEKTVYRCRNCHNEWTVSGKYRPYQPQAGATLTLFRDDDTGYRSWIRAWSDGFVLNCERTPGPNYLVLHRATCRSITDLQPGTRTFTGEYVKVCSTKRRAVARWAQEQTGADITPCQLCM